MPCDPVVDAPAAVVVDHDAGDSLAECVASLRADGVKSLVVVDNASTDGSADRLERAQPAVRVLRPGRNLGYGAGANLGWHTVGEEFVVVSNPDVVVHQGALDTLVAILRADDSVAIAGPCILETDGTRYPSARRFPSWVDAAGHAVLGQVAPRNPFTRRYRMDDLDAAAPTAVDWVSGAFFVARRSALEELGGFDERYFMYLEDVDLCWRAARAGYGVVYVPAASVTHLQGLSTARHPYRMLVEHHRSALRFAGRRATGWRRIALVPVAVVLAIRLVVSCIATARQVRRRRHGPSAGAD